MSATISKVHIYEVDTTVADYRLESPTVGSRTEAYAIRLQGWAVDRRSRPVAITVWGKYVNFPESQIAISRPDVEALHPDVPWARESGFLVIVNLLGLPREFDLFVSVVLEDGSSHPIALIHGSRALVEDESEPMQPIMVTSLGRSGSSLVMDILSRHPEIVAYPVWDAEAKVSTYWAELLSVMTDPRSYLQPFASVMRQGRWWMGDGRQYDEPLADGTLEEWLGTEQVREAARFCRERITAFYTRLAEEDGRQGAVYFAEKCGLRRPAYAELLREIYPQTREILLVRDFRDMYCSMVAYSERAGSDLFGRDSARSEEENIRMNLATQANLIAANWEARSDWAHLLRYEDLIRQPEESIQLLLSYLGFEGTDEIPAMLAALPYGDFATDHAHGTSTSALSSIGRWRNELDPGLAAACESALGDALAAFGYSTDRTTVTG